MRARTEGKAIPHLGVEPIYPRVARLMVGGVHNDETLVRRAGDSVIDRTIILG